VEEGWLLAECSERLQVLIIFLVGCWGGGGGGSEKQSLDDNKSSRKV